MDEAPKLEPRVTKTEVIANDKDGTLEKVYFQKEARTVKREDGTEYTKLVTPWEVRATGRKVQELRGTFKDVAPQMIDQGLKDWTAGGGDLVISKPDGTTDTIRADKEQMYREMHGFGTHRVHPGISIDGFGGMRAAGLSRLKIRYHNGQREIVEAR